MPLDTRNTRASALFMTQPWRALLPAPDSTVDQADRQQTVWLYAGLMAGLPPARRILNFAAQGLRLQHFSAEKIIIGH